MQNPMVIQLITGYYRPTGGNSNVYDACGSVTLIKDHSKVILVDCGGPWDKNLLDVELEKHCVKYSDVTDLICTHGHIDHVGNMNLFTNANIFLDRDIGSSPGVYQSLSFDTNGCFTLSKNTRFISTPGHTNHDLSVIIDNVIDKGTVVVAGDIFENENDRLNSDSWKCSSWNIKIQEKSRNEIMKIADYIIPGHGSMFKTKITE